MSRVSRIILIIFIMCNAGFFFIAGHYFGRNQAMKRTDMSMLFAYVQGRFFK